jgi:ATP-binding cassette subfamily B protein
LETPLTKTFDEDGMELSGGQWQKVALARAFYRNADIVILDEPSAALDPEAEHLVFTKFMELSKDKGAVLISHRLSNVIIADRIIVLEDGKVAEQGSHTKLMKQNGRYAYLFNLQADKYNSIDNRISKVKVV